MVVRVLSFIYEEQSGCVRLAGVDSDPFTLTNGTRQGSVISPALWCIYLDGLLWELRKRKLGCFVRGLWMGACAYADDLLCLAPTRLVLQKMMEVCEQYGREHNLVFSTDPVPSKSKTKGIFFCGEKTRARVKYPDKVLLNGEELPWEVTGEHLGHTFQPRWNYGAGCQGPKSTVHRPICGYQRKHAVCWFWYGDEGS